MERESEELAAELGPVLEFLRAIWAVNHAMERVSIRMESALGLTAQQRVVIRILGKVPGITSSKLAELLHVDPGSITAVMKRLEARGLVAKKTDPSDRRRASLSLTTQGRRLDVPARVSVEHAVASVLERTTHADLAALRRLLNRLVETLEQTAAADDQ